MGNIVLNALMVLGLLLVCVAYLDTARSMGCGRKKKDSEEE